MPHTQPAPDAAPDDAPFGRPVQGWRRRAYAVIFESDTRAGRLFDIALIWLILLSVGVVMLDSVASLHARFGDFFTLLEWAFTLIFSAEYLARLICVREPLRYARSFYGVIDLLAIVPTYAAFFMPGLHALIDVRVLRLLRVFRILKLTEYIAEFGAMRAAIAASRRKIMVFIAFVMLVVVVMGTLMYVIEGPAHGYTSIPVGIYWAITTLTTVGFGDITPKSDLGRLIASMMMLLGWGTLAVPTGIVSAEFTSQRLRRELHPRTCPRCLSVGHVETARFCSECGTRLPPI